MRLALSTGSPGLHRPSVLQRVLTALIGRDERTGTGTVAEAESGRTAKKTDLVIGRLDERPLMSNSTAAVNALAADRQGPAWSLRAEYANRALAYL